MSPCERTRCGGVFFKMFKRITAPTGLRSLLMTGLLLSTAMAACNGKGDEKLEASLIHKVAKGELVETVVESGSIAPWYEVQLKTKVSGEVESVLVEEGASVTQDQLLMTLKEIDYSRQVTLAEVSYQEARLNVRNAQIELDRSQAAFDARGISKYELDRAAYQVDLAKVRLQRAEVELSTARDQLGYTKVVSPIDGVVIARNIEPGEMVTAGVTSLVNGEPQLTIARLDKLSLELNLNQVDVAKVMIGQKATVILDAYRDTPVEGEVASIAAAAITDSRKGIAVFQTKITVDPSKSSVNIKPGMTAEVKIHVGTYPDVVKVPTEAVFEEEGKQYVYLVKESTEKGKDKVKEKIEVQVGHRGATEVEITQGLTEGQEIYLKGDTKNLERKID